MTNKTRLEKLEKQAKLITPPPLWNLEKLTNEELLTLESIVKRTNENQELADQELIDLERMFCKATGGAYDDK